ncbi:MAG TPA: hypothetical protein PLL76_20990 [Thermoanaerobaculia bacterium]|nr:hypothetical protein [Thermoanaerobaculia bacterium]
MKKLALTLTALLVLSGCGGMLPPEPEFVCTVVQKDAVADPGGFRLAMKISEDARFLLVDVKNTSDRPMQLLLQEWSIAAGGSTSAIATGDTPNGQVATAVLAPVTLPAGGDWKDSLYMRSLHNFSYGSYFLDRMVPRNCGDSFELKLTYVVQTETKKVIETLPAAGLVERKPNPKYRPTTAR